MGLWTRKTRSKTLTKEKLVLKTSVAAAGTPGCPQRQGASPSAKFMWKLLVE
jgi:hypothetical protein